MRACGFRYDNQDAVIDVNMEVVSGDYLCIGGGKRFRKSTLMKGLLGLLKPTAGKLTVDEGFKENRDRLSSPADSGPEGFSRHRV